MMKNTYHITIHNLRLSKTKTLKKIINYWEDNEPDTILLSYFELKKRNKIDYCDKEIMQSIFFNFEEIDQFIHSSVTMNLSYETTLITMKFLKDIKIYLN